MFLKSLSQINFADVENFCKEFSEGTRVEYKSKMIENIPKTILAFANTQGGIIIIGVEADKVNNKAIFPIRGIDKIDGIEDKITSSSLNGIYPPVIPEVRIIEVPNEKDKIVVVMYSFLNMR